MTRSNIIYHSGTGCFEKAKQYPVFSWYSYDFFDNLKSDGNFFLIVFIVINVMPLIRYMYYFKREN